MPSFRPETGLFCVNLHLCNFSASMLQLDQRDPEAIDACVDSITKNHEHLALH